MFFYKNTVCLNQSIQNNSLLYQMDSPRIFDNSIDKKMIKFLNNNKWTKSIKNKAKILKKKIFSIWLIIHRLKKISKKNIYFWKI